MQILLINMILFMSCKIDLIIINFNCYLAKAHSAACPGANIQDECRPFSVWAHARHPTQGPKLQSRMLASAFKGSHSHEGLRRSSIQIGHYGKIV